MGIQNLDRCWFNPTAGGSGDWVVSSALAGYMTPAQAGAANGETLYYAAQSSDLSEWEIGNGAYNSGTATIPRTNILFSSNANAKVTFTTTPTVFVTLTAEALAALGLQIATTGQIGVVKPDGTTVTVDPDGTIHSPQTTTWSYAPGSSGSNAGVASIGHRFALQSRNITLFSASMLFTTVTGATYKMGIAPWDDVNKKITAAPTYADASYTETAGGLKCVSFRWAAGVSMSLASPGPMYLIFLVRTDSTSTVGITANFTTSNQVGENIYLSESSAAAHLASLAPATTDTWTMNNATYVIPMTYALG